MKQTQQFINNELQDLYPPDEIRWFIRLILEHVCGMSHTEQILRKDSIISSDDKEKIKKIVSRLVRMEPFQYIIGETVFCNLLLHVSPAVLIPRPETAELVNIIIKDAKRQSTVNILDIGTGSGCIAIALACSLPHAIISAIDVSLDAIATAKANDANNHINFQTCDILDSAAALNMFLVENFDIIVSNPPYITESEKSAMSANVLDYEPYIALFVPDDNPLMFYEPIARFAKAKLKPVGKLYLEINPLFVTELKEMLENHGFKTIELLKDINSKYRFITASMS
ncbi:MAG: peptide chain release factor N(5)-glutamine methyltransferase [Tannerella sp.]|jgi:release factor glutamine methyltransferase|nr:peptide chain release factor N(5)-glutamine methyltransferase [Tannerella sp.]